MYKMFFAMRAAEKKGADPFLPTPWMCLFDRGWRRKNYHFFNTISQTKTSVWGLNKAFFKKI
jgi:hypothetical protein